MLLPSYMCLFVFFDTLFFFFLKIYLFIYGYAGSSLLLRLFSRYNEEGLFCHCGAPASHCGGFSCCRAGAQ